MTPGNPCRPVLFFAFGALAALGMAAAPGSARAASCPNLDGHYRVDGFGAVLGDALGALGIPLAGFTDSEVKIDGSGGNELRLWVKSGRSGPMARAPSRVLVRDVDFDCGNGVLTLRQAVAATRKTDAGFLEGSAKVRLGKSGAGLDLTAEFHGGERTTLYSYDSARVSVPKLGTGRTLVESIRWPGIDEARPAPLTHDTPPEAQSVADLRGRLKDLLGNVRLGGLTEHGGRVHASVGASTSEDVVAFEDRLRAARLAYTTIRAPIWTNNQYYMEFAFAAATGAGASGWHPSVFRVEQELERLRRPMVSVRKVSEADGAYVAELEVIGDEAVDTILAGLRANTTMFRDIAVLDDTPQADRRNLRVVRLRVRVE